MTISEYVEKLLEDVAQSGDEFDAYLKANAAKLPGYFAPDNVERSVLFRASSAGTCWQAQVYKAAGVPESNVVKRPGKQLRALHNGTFTHARYHMYFEFLQSKGLLKIIAAEEMRENAEFQLSGTVDCVIEIKWLEKTLRFVVDFKSIKAKYFQELLWSPQGPGGPKKEHEAQQAKYDILGWGADGWMMIYEEKDSHEVKVFAKAYNQGLITKIKGEHAAAIAWVAAREGKLPLPPIVLDRKWCSYCEWKKTCTKENGAK
jgi:hypothetical protein